MKNHRREKKISVVCNIGGIFNPGTMSADLGFPAICLRHGYTNLEYFYLLSPDEYRSYFEIEHGKDSLRDYVQGSPVKYGRLLGRLSDLSASDAIVYWSGWLHSPAIYDLYKKCLLNMSLAKDDREATDLVNQHIYLTNQSDEVLKKTISFGQTVLFNTLRHEVTPGYGDAYQSFYRRVRSAYMRDAFSAQKIKRLRSDFEHSHLCVDCASFLHEADVDNLPGNVSEADLTFCYRQIGVFFARSSIDDDKILAVVQILCDALNKRAFSLPWGSRFVFPQAKSLPYPTPSSAGKPVFSIGDQLRMIRHSAAIVTDTYHVCVNAWAMGIPAICIAETLSTSELDLNSGYRFSSIDKRFTFYATIDALDFFVYGEELKDLAFLKAHLISIARLMENPSSIEQIASAVRKEVIAAEKNLINELERILGPS